MLLVAQIIEVLALSHYNKERQHSSTLFVPKKLHFFVEQGDNEAAAFNQKKAWNTKDINLAVG